jgi:hypothetical protein
MRFYEIPVLYSLFYLLHVMCLYVDKYLASDTFLSIMH